MVLVFGSVFSSLVQSVDSVCLIAQLSSSLSVCSMAIRPRFCFSWGEGENTGSIWVARLFGSLGSGCGGMGCARSFPSGGGGPGCAASPIRIPACACVGLCVGTVGFNLRCGIWWVVGLVFLFLLRVEGSLGLRRETGFLCCLGFSGCVGWVFDGVCSPFLACAGLCVRAAGLGFGCSDWCVWGCPFFPSFPLFLFPFVGWDRGGAGQCGGVIGAAQWSRGGSFWGPYGGYLSSCDILVLVMRVFVFCGWRSVRASRVIRVLSRFGLLVLCGFLCLGFFLCVFGGGLWVFECGSCFNSVSGGGSGWFCVLCSVSCACSVGMGPFPGGFLFVVLRFALCQRFFVCMYSVIHLFWGCCGSMLFILRIRRFPYFHFSRGFLVFCLSPYAFLGWGGEGSAFGIVVCGLVGVRRVSVMRLVSSSSARLRGLCIRGGGRPFVWFGLSVWVACLGSVFCWGWAGCPGRVWVLWSSRGLMFCCLIGVVLGGRGLSVMLLLCVRCDACGDMVPVVGCWGLFRMWEVGVSVGVLWVCLLFVCGSWGFAWEFVLLGVPILCCFFPVGGRVVGVCGSVVRAVRLGFGYWGWACPDLVLAFSVACGSGSRSRREWFWCFIANGGLF
jgi:hypothetical protein